MIQEEKKNNTKPSKLKKNWLKRIGVLGFLFFLIKGIVCNLKNKRSFKAL